jgi:pimeloyl-ACP methyl ester carboxylesterase
LRATLRFLTLRSDWWQRSRKHRAGRLCCKAFYWYVGVLLVLLWLENWFLFHPSPLDRTGVGPLGSTLEEVEKQDRNGNRIHAWWCTPDGWTPERGAVLFSHGNAANVSVHAAFAWPLVEHGHAVLLYDYPGFGRSTGKPTEQSCYEAGAAMLGWLTEERHIPAERVVLYGHSLGGAVATELATRGPCRALVLQSAFTSFPDIAQDTFPIFPCRWLVRNRMDNIGKIRTIHVPVLLGHGTADRLIPYAHAERLLAAANDPKELYSLPGFDHNDLPPPAYFQAVDAFLDRTAPLPPG